MSWVRRSERFRGYKRTVTRPIVLGKVCTYRSEFSRIPEQVRLCFADGTTAVYDLRVEQPAPVIWR